MSTSTLSGLVLLLTALSTSAGMAQGTQAQRAACTPDAFRLCSSEIPNVERITSCMRRQKDKLSNACKLVFDQVEPASRTATRSVTTAAAGASAEDWSGWCDFGDSPAPGQDVWVAWCKETARPK